MWPTKRVGANMWPRRRADEAPLPRASEGRRTRGTHQTAADVAPLSNAGAFFSKNVRWWRVQKHSEKFELPLIFLCRRQVLTNTYREGEQAGRQAGE